MSAIKGKPLSEEHKAKISAAHIGMKHTAETKAKISCLNKGRKHTAETKAKMSASHKGRKRAPFTAEHKDNMRIAALKYWAAYKENKDIDSTE